MIPPKKLSPQPPHDQSEYRYRNVSSLKKLSYLLRKDYGNLLLALFFYTIKNSPVWVMPVLIANVINIIILKPVDASHQLLISYFFMAGLILQNILTHTVYERLISRSIRQMEAELRSSLIRRMHQLSMGFHENFKSGKMQSKILRDVESVEILIRQFITVIFSSLVSIVFAMTLTLKKEPLIALTYLFTVPLAVFLFRGFKGVMSRKTSEFRSEIENMSAHVSEMIEMLPVTRSMGAEEIEVRKMDRYLTEIQSKGIILDTVNALFGASSWVSFNFFQVTTFFICALLAFKGRILIGDVVMYNSFYAMIINSVSGLIAVTPMLTRGLDSLNSIGEILESPDIENNDGKLPVTKVKGDIIFEKVSFVYPAAKDVSVNNFSFNVRHGEVIAFIGSSGSGKSTIMSLMIGFRRPTSGRILLDGCDMEKLDLRQYRRFLAVVPQQTTLFSGTIRDNITYGLESISEKKVIEAAETAYAMEFIEKLPDGFNTVLGEHGAKLSGGQRQRISIARAIIRDPRIIIFDEATSALDTISEHLIHEAIKRIAVNRTTFIVSHRLSTIENADKIIVMKNGACVESGNYNKLMALKGEFYRLKNLIV